MKRQASKQVSFAKGMIENVKQETLTESGQVVSLLYLENYDPNLEANSLVMRTGYTLVDLNPATIVENDGTLNNRTITTMFPDTDQTTPVVNYSVIQTKGHKSNWSRIIFLKDKVRAVRTTYQKYLTAMYASLPTNYPLINLLSFSYYYDITPTLATAWYNIYDYLCSQRNITTAPYGIVPIGHFSENKNYGQAVYFNTLPDETLYTTTLLPYHKLAYKWSFFDYTKKREDNNLWWNGLPIAGVTNGLLAEKEKLTGWKVWDNKLPTEIDVTWYGTKQFGIPYVTLVEYYLIFIGGMSPDNAEGAALLISTDLNTTYALYLQAISDTGDVSYTAIPYADAILQLDSTGTVTGGGNVILIPTNTISGDGFAQSTWDHDTGVWRMVYKRTEMTSIENTCRGGIYHDGVLIGDVLATKTDITTAVNADLRPIRVGVSIVPNITVSSDYNNAIDIAHPLKLAVSTMEMPADKKLGKVMINALNAETKAILGINTVIWTYTSISAGSQGVRVESIAEKTLFFEKAHTILPLAKYEDYKDPHNFSSGYEECYAVIPLTLNNYIENKTSRSWLGHETFAMLLTIEIEGIEYIVSQNVIDMDELHKASVLTGTNQMAENIGEYGLLPVARDGEMNLPQWFQGVDFDGKEPSKTGSLNDLIQSEELRRAARIDAYMQDNPGDGVKTIKRGNIEFNQHIGENAGFPYLVDGSMQIQIIDTTYTKSGVVHSKNGFTTNNSYYRIAGEKPDGLATIHLRIDLSINQAMFNKLTDMNAGSLKVYMQKTNAGSSFVYTGVYSPIEPPPILYHFYDKTKYKKTDYSNYGLVFQAGINEKPITFNKTVSNVRDAVENNKQTKWYSQNSRYYASGVDGTFLYSDFTDKVTSTKQIIPDYPATAEVLNLGGSGQYLETTGSEFLEVIKGVFFFAGLRDKYNTEISNDVYWGIIQDGHCSYFATYKENKIAFGSLPVTALINFREHLVVFNRNEFYRMQLPEPFNPATWEVIDKNKGQGTYSPRTVCMTPYGFCFANENGIWLSDGGKPKSLTDSPNEGLAIYNTYARIILPTNQTSVLRSKAEPYEWNIVTTTSYNLYAELSYDSSNDELVLSSEAIMTDQTRPKLLVKLIYSFKYQNWRIETIPLPLVIKEATDYIQTTLTNYSDTHNVNLPVTNTIQQTANGYGRNTVYGESLETLTYCNDFSTFNVLPQIIAKSRFRILDYYNVFNYSFWQAFDSNSNVITEHRTFIKGILATHTFGDYENDFILKQLIMSVAPIAQSEKSVVTLPYNTYNATDSDTMRDPILNVTLRTSKYKPINATTNPTSFDIWRANAVKIAGANGSKNVFYNKLQTNENDNGGTQQVRHESWVLASPLNAYYRGMNLEFKSWLVSKINAIYVESVEMKRREQ